MLASACRTTSPQRDPQPLEPFRQLALATIHLGGPVRLADSVFLQPPAVTFMRGGDFLPYREAEVPVRMEKDRVIFKLLPQGGGGAAIHYEIAESRDHAQSVIRFWSDAPLPDMYLQAAAPADLLPVRLQPRGDRESALSVVGPVMYAACEALYDPRLDYAVSMDQPFQYFADQPNPDGGLLGVRFVGGTHETKLTFKFVANLLKDRFKLSSTPGQAPAMAPAEVCVLQAVRTEATAANALDEWARAELGLSGKWLARPSAGGVPGMICLRPAATATAPAESEGPGKDWKRRFDRARDIHGRVAERGERYNWQHARELLGTTLDEYWAHGTVRTNTAAPLLVGAPLSLEHARMWVSLMGLSGQGVVVGGDARSLPAERLELLRAILPPAPLRSADLFAHQFPEQWVAMGTRDWRLSRNESAIEPTTTLGLFNWSLEPRTMIVQLAELMPALKLLSPQDEGPALAVYDFWRDQLFALARESFEVPLPPASCRVFRILPVLTDRPQLVRAGPRLIETTADLRDLGWDAAQLTISGTSTVAAGRELALQFLVPQSQDSFEVEEARAQGLTGQIRAIGPIRRVAFEPGESGDFKWLVRFRRAVQQLEPPDRPVGLEASHDTRGVLLKWSGDAAAAVYQVHRDGTPLGRTSDPQYLDSTGRYGQSYTYTVSALDYAGRPSAPSEPVTHRAPVPASMPLTDLIPLLAEQEHLAVMKDASAAGKPLQVAGRRHERGLGTHSNARIVYFLGAGYRTFTGQIGIDDETQGQGSCTFKILADGELLFTSELLRGGEPAQAFSVPVQGRMRLELVVTDGGDSPDNDHADWCNPRLESNS